MHYRSVLYAFFLALGTAVHGDSLNKQQISADAKWLIHLDCDNLRKTQLGKYLFRNLLEPKVAEFGDQLKLNVTSIVERIGSITAYGADFKAGPDSTGVLLINSDADTQKVLEGVLAAQVLANTNGPVKQLQNEEHHLLYSIGDQVFVAPQKGGPIVISKSEEQIDVVRNLLAGKGENLASTKTFSHFPGLSNSFVFVGVADAASLPAAIPARAKVLQMADGGQIALGEKAEQVFVDVALHGKTPEVTRQIQQVLEGMLALVSLGQGDNPDLAELAKSTKVSCVDQLISLRVEYPADKVIARLGDELKEKPQKAKHTHKKAQKGMKKQQPAHDKDEPKAEAEDEAEPAK